MRLLGYCIMPNHFHLIMVPGSAHQMSQFMRRFTGVHAQFWQHVRESIGSGAIYQGRYKGVPVQSGRYFYNVCRYVERNPVRAGFVTKAQDWPWSSLWRRVHGEDADLLDPWPVPCPDNWLDILNAAPISEDEDLEAVRHAIRHTAPLGDPEWSASTAKLLGLNLRPEARGRPRKITI